MITRVMSVIRGLAYLSRIYFGKRIKLEARKKTAESVAIQRRQTERNRPFLTSDQKLAGSPVRVLWLGALSIKRECSLPNASQLSQEDPSVALQIDTSGFLHPQAYSWLPLKALCEANEVHRKDSAIATGTSSAVLRDP